MTKYALKILKIWKNMQQQKNKNKNKIFVLTIICTIIFISHWNNHFHHHQSSRSWYSTSRKTIILFITDSISYYIEI